MKQKIQGVLTAPDGAGGGVAGALAGVALTIGQANGILAGVMAGLAAYKAIRDAWKAAHPGQDGPFLTDDQLIDTLRSNAAAGLAEVDAVLAKYGVQPPADGGPVV